MATCPKKCNTAKLARTQAHCTVCHQTFATVPLFDDHRVGQLGKRSCRTPRSMKLKRVYGVWDTPGHGATVTKRVTAMREARS